MCLSSRVELFRIGALRLGTTIESASILASVIDVEIAKINTSLLAVYQSTYLYNGSYSYSENT